MRIHETIAKDITGSADGVSKVANLLFAQGERLWSPYRLNSLAVALTVLTMYSAAFLSEIIRGRRTVWCCLKMDIRAGCEHRLATEKTAQAQIRRADLVQRMCEQQSRAKAEATILFKAKAHDLFPALLPGQRRHAPGKQRRV